MLIGGVGTLVMFTLVILGMPVTFALWLIAFLGIWFVKNLTVADAMLVLETQANIYSSSCLLYTSPSPRD